MVDPTSPKIKNHKSIPDQPLVTKSVDLTPLVVHQVFSVESGSHPPHVLLVSSGSSDLEKYYSILVVQEAAPPAPMMEFLEDAPLAPVTPGDDHVISMVPPPSSLVASFDWSRFAGYHLPSYVPFEITVQAFNMVIPSTIIDEAESISILSSTT